MNAEAIRTLYEYHFALNRRVWTDCVMRLSDAQFVAELDYSVGSIRNQAVHVMSVDQRWFARLQGEQPPTPLEPKEFGDRAAVRARWDAVEKAMNEYLARLTDGDAARTITYTLRSGRAGRSPAWQILVHVVNHGTDHRAQMLAMLHRLGAPTLEQDLVMWLAARV